jgi:glycosyltransferase involved in cell wall biosynthesis
MFARDRRAILNSCDLVIAVSDFIRDAAIDLGVDPTRVVRHYIGVDTRFFDGSATEDSRPTVLFVGRLVQQKGCAHLIRAMSKVQSAVPEARLVVAGAGPEQKRCIDLAASSLRDAEFVGAVSQSEVRSLMARSTVFCVPSHRALTGCREAFGLVYTEAQAMQVPVVAYRSGGIQEAVADGVSGILVDEGDIDALAVAIEMVLTNPSLARRLGHAGRQRVVERFDIDRQGAELGALYARVAAGAN